MGRRRRHKPEADADSFRDKLIGRRRYLLPMPTVIDLPVFQQHSAVSLAELRMLSLSGQRERVMSRETFETLLAPHLGWVRNMVRTRLGGSGHADDVLQEILLRAFMRKGQLRTRDKFKSWLWSIAMNAVRMCFRRNRGILSLTEFPNLDSCDAAMSPLARAESAEMHEWLRSCIAKLAAYDKALIRLRDMEGKTIFETAAALNKSASATKTAHFRARRRLASIMRAGGKHADKGNDPVQRNLKAWSTEKTILTA